MSRTKDELIETAVRQIDSCLQRLDGASAEQLRGPVLHLVEALHALLFDDAPTPQVSLDADDDLQVEWLVNDTSMTLVIDPDGGSLWAVDASGEELFVEEWSAIAWPYAAFAKAGDLLRRMSGAVTVRAPH